MGICIECGRDIYLKKGEYHCDNCGVRTKYFCWKCKHIINIEEITPIYKDEKECSWCGFYVCPSCNACGRKKVNNELIECERIECLRDLQNDLIQGIKPLKSHVIQILGSIKNGKKTKYCLKNIPRTHAKKTIKDYYLLMKGWKNKNDNDVKLFIDRFEKILNSNNGDTWTISDKREDGTHGFEVREACNLAVCMGSCIIEKNKNGFIEYKKIDADICEYWNDNGIIKMYCPKCKTEFGMDKKICTICPPISKGIRKGEYIKLKIKNTNVSTCMYKSIDFKEDINKNG